LAQSAVDDAGGSSRGSREASPRRIDATDGHRRGRNKDGELGQPQATKEQGKRATVPGLGKVSQVALASQLSCAILENKHVKCWGSGKLGGKVLDNAQPTEVEGIDDAEELEASGAIVCARGSKGIKCWGEDEKSIGTPPSGVFKQISTGFTHGCALDQKGAVTCWGVGDWGPKGKYTTPGVKDALEVVTGDRHACVIAKDKSVLCWGMNEAGLYASSEADRGPRHQGRNQALCG
jgi:alpha-tubulin suppressor-like RCC1 family protein